MEWKAYEEKFDKEFISKKEWFENEYSKIKTGRVNPNVFDMVKIDYYDSLTKINEISTISIVNARTVVIKPFETQFLNKIATAIKETLGYESQIDANCLKIFFPAPTEESRKESVKKIKDILEHGKINVRNIRKNILSEIKNDKELREDELKSYEKRVDELTKKYTSILDEIFKLKEKELMTI